MSQVQALISASPVRITSGISSCSYSKISMIRPLWRPAIRLQAVTQPRPLRCQPQHVDGVAVAVAALDRVKDQDNSGYDIILLVYLFWFCNRIWYVCFAHPQFLLDCSIYFGYIFCWSVAPVVPTNFVLACFNTI